MTTNITTGLLLASQKVGKLNKSLTNFISDKFSVLAISDSWAVTRDISNSKIRIQAADGTKRDYTNTYSEAYETNILIVSNKMILLSSENFNIYASIVDLTNGNVIKKIFIVKDTTPVDPSIILDSANNRAIIYSSRPVAGTGWIFAIDFLLFNKTTLYLETNNAFLDYITVHLDILANGTIYRSFVRADLNQREISKLTILSSTLDGQIFDYLPIGGKTVIVSAAGTYLYYPKFINNIIYVLSEDSSQFLAYNANALDDILIGPITIDTRQNQTLSSGVMYPRWQFDSSTNYLHDTRTFFTWDTISGSQITNEYKICIDNEVWPQVFTNDLTVAQPCRVFAQTSKSVFYRANNKNYIFELQKDLSCEITKPIEQASQQFQMKSATKLFRSDITTLVGTLYYQLPINEKAVFSNEKLDITYSGTTIIVNAVTHSLDGSNLLNLCKMDYGTNSSVSDRYIVRTTNRFLLFDENGNELLNETPNSSLTTQYYSFIFNDKFYVVHSFGIISLNLIDYTRQITTGFWFGDPLNVKIFVNPFTKELNLYDRAQPNILRKINYEPLFVDFTNPSLLNDYSEIITNTLPSSVPKINPSEHWSITWLDPQTLLYIDYTNNLYEKIENNIESIDFGTISTNQVNIFEPSPTITIIGDLIFDRNSRDILSIKTDIKKPRSIIKYPNPLSDSSLLAVYSDDEAPKALIDNAIYTFIQRVEQQNQTALALNKLRFTLFSADFGELLQEITLTNCNIESYDINPIVKNLDLETFNNGTKVSSTDSNEVLFDFNLSLVVSTDELRLLLLIYYSQIKQSSETGFIEIKMADTIVEQVSSTQNRERLSIGNFFQYNVLFEDLQWFWFSDEKYQIQLKIKEVSKYNG